MKQCVLVIPASALLAFWAAASGCAEYHSVHVAPPDCWSPYLQPVRPIIKQWDIPKDGLVITSRYPGGLVVYNRGADRWREYTVPKGHRIESSYPHLWWTTSVAGGRYWNLKTGVTCSFQALPDELFARPRGPVDQGVRPWARIADDKLWSWIPSAKTYRSFDPFKDQWQDLPKSGELPQRLAVQSVVETPESICITLAPRFFCTMRPMLEGPGVFKICTYAKSEGKWSVVKAATHAESAPEIYLDAGKGWWVIRDGQAYWQPKDVKKGETQRRAYYGVFRSTGRLWGWADSRFVEVTGFDKDTGDPIPALTKHCSLQGRFLYDGKYIWEWRGGDILRHRPNVSGSRSYRGLWGVRWREYPPRFTRRAIWFRGIRRYEKHTGKWTRMIWRGSPLPENNRGFETAITERETFILVFDNTPSGPLHEYRGIARYDPNTNIATYYTAGQILSGQWPYGAVSPDDSGAHKGSVPHAVYKAWNMLLEKCGQSGPAYIARRQANQVKSYDGWRFERRGKPAALIAENTKTGRTVKLAYTEYVCFDEQYVYAYINNKFHRAGRRAFLAALAAK